MIKLTNVEKGFANKKILTNINLKFESGKTYALVGKSGCGKTTLLDLIGLIEKADHGEVNFNGVINTTIDKRLGRKLLREDIGYLFQNYGLIENQSIKQNLAHSLIYQKLSNKQKKLIMLDTLNSVDISHELDTIVATLSGGEKQRVAIAKLLLKMPKVIICDEPTANLDQVTEKKIINLIFEQLIEHQLLIIATHNQSIAQMCDEIINVELISEKN